MTADAVVHKAFDMPRMRLSVRRDASAAPLLVRAVGLFAARTSLPVDRLRDISNVLEAMAASLPGARVTLDARVEREGQELQLAVCELPPGAARSVIAGVYDGELADVLATASDGVAVRSTQRSGESLVVTFLSTRA